MSTMIVMLTIPTVGLACFEAYARRASSGFSKLVSALATGSVPAACQPLYLKVSRSGVPMERGLDALRSVLSSEQELDTKLRHARLSLILRGCLLLLLAITGGFLLEAMGAVVEQGSRLQHLIAATLWMTIGPIIRLHQLPRNLIWQFGLTATSKRLFLWTFLCTEEIGAEEIRAEDSSADPLGDLHPDLRTDLLDLYRRIQETAQTCRRKGLPLQQRQQAVVHSWWRLRVERDQQRIDRWLAWNPLFELICYGPGLFLCLSGQILAVL